MSIIQKLNLVWNKHGDVVVVMGFGSIYSVLQIHAARLCVSEHNSQSRHFDLEYVKVLNSSQ